jgi:sterol desaturase/sphingolipid hydroxylase (fatty acid hydroxylase superfamily)
MLAEVMPPEIKPKNQGSKQLFKSPVLEKLSRTHISIPLLIFTTFASALLYWSITHTTLSAVQTTLMFLLGVVSFSWVEYTVHRHVFHMTTYSKLREKAQYMMHGVHHEFPKDKDRLAMPPLVSVTISTILLLLFRLVLGDLAFSFLPGFLVGYAAYLSIHYVVHAYPPPKNIFRKLWINHSMHHYKNGDIIFGVSSPLWDYIYGTMKDKKSSA